MERSGAPGRVSQPGFRVTTLAALDLHGFNGSRRRRVLIFAEFVLAALCGLVLGALCVARGSSMWKVFGVYLVGLGCNYLALTVAASRMLRAHALRRRLEGVDIPSELRRYAGGQLRLLVPFLVAVLAAMEYRRARS